MTRHKLFIKASAVLPVSSWDIDDEHGLAGRVAFRGQGPAEATSDGDLGLVAAVKELIDRQVEAVLRRLVLKRLSMDVKFISFICKRINHLIVRRRTLSW